MPLTITQIPKEETFYSLRPGDVFSDGKAFFLKVQEADGKCLGVNLNDFTSRRFEPSGKVVSVDAELRIVK